jgi:hypothetical protein
MLMLLVLASRMSFCSIDRVHQVDVMNASHKCWWHAQVATLEFHPEIPLLATLDRRNYLTVWDYVRGEPVCECQLGADSLYNKETMDAVARAEANPDHFGPKMHAYMAANYLQPSSYGRPRSLAFLDLDTVCWSIMARRLLTQGAVAKLPSVAHVKVLAEQRRLVVACEKAVILLDIVSKRVSPHLHAMCLVLERHVVVLQGHANH